jgi:hypothetical protein
MVKTNLSSLNFSKTHCLELRTRNLTLNLLMTTIVAPPSNASKWQMGFNSAFKGLKIKLMFVIITIASLTPLAQSFWG